MILILSLSCLCALTTIGLVFSLLKNLELMDKLNDVQEAIQQSVDMLDEQFMKIDQKSKIEIFSDEPVVKELVRDIAVSRNSVLKVAQILDSSLTLTPVEETQETRES